MNLNLGKKVVLVTGGGRDIGKEISNTFAYEGASVAINFNNSSKDAEQTAEEINSKGGVAKIFKADITKYNEVLKMVQSIKKDLGSIDFLIVERDILD